MKETKIKPVADRVLIEPEEVESKTAGGIFIPDNAKPKPSVGFVVAKGDATKFVAIGNKVQYNKGAGIDVHGDDELICIKEADIYLIL